MRATALALLVLLLGCLVGAAAAPPLAAQPTQRLDAVQAETALRLVQEGDELRLFDARSTDVVYEPLGVASRQAVADAGGRYLLLNGERLDLATVWIPEVDEPRRFANLAVLLGFSVDGAPAELPRALDPALELAAHAGFYTGTLAERPAQLSLVLDGRRLEGFLGDEADAAGLVVLTGQSYNATRTRGESLEILVRDAEDRILAVLRGELDGESRSFSGTWAPLDGAPPRSFTFTRAADYAIRESRRGAAAFTAVYPRFRHPPASELNDALEKASRAAEEAFLDAWSDAPAAPGLFHRERREVIVSYLRPELLSLRQKLLRPGGEALGARISGENQRYSGGDFNLFSLAECFRPAARDALATLVTARLRAAGRAPAGLAKLDPAALERFYLVPGGVRVLLPTKTGSRAAGRVGNGADGVILSFAELREILDPEGPLGRLVPLK